jgi:hypothetical protein
MSTVSSQARVVHFDSRRPVRRNSATFGRGLCRDNTARRVDRTEADIRWWAAQAVAFDPSEDEVRERHELMTMSRDEYRDLEWAAEECRAQLRCNGWHESELAECFGARGPIGGER